VALLLRKQGVRRIRPLQGGLDAWRKLGYPVQNGEAVVGTNVSGANLA
jgi:rhodanese-related sulfurtransferase